MAEPPVCLIDATGIHRPTFEQCLAWFADRYRGIYGQDIAIDPDTQDGQWLRTQADALHQSNGVAVSVFNAFSLSSAQGTSLSRLVKLNGLQRKIASRSSADVRLVGVAGTVIENGTVTGPNGSVWNLPASVTIPYEGEITVTVQAAELGAVPAPSQTLIGIPQPVPGWQSVINDEPAVMGAPIETDPQLKRRQKVSTTKPSRAILEGIAAEILDLPGVTRVKTYERPTFDPLPTNVTAPESYQPPGFTDLPIGSVAFVVEGGDVDAIATAIGQNKASGTLDGTTTGLYVDGAGIGRRLPFYRTHVVPVAYRVILRKRAGWTSDIADTIKAGLVAWTGLRDIGERIVRARAYLPAQLYGNANLGAGKYELVSVEIGREDAPPGEHDVVLAFDEAAQTSLDAIDIEFVA